MGLKPIYFHEAPPFKLVLYILFVAVFEGEKIAYLDKHGTYRPDGRQVEEDDTAQTADDYVLQKLFKKTGWYCFCGERGSPLHVHPQEHR